MERILLVIIIVLLTGTASYGLDRPIQLAIKAIPLIPLLISIIDIIVGLLIFLKPELTIEIQRKFYERINWRMEPVSMQKEVLNTKIMGMFAVVIASAAVIYFIMNAVIG